MEETQHDHGKANAETADQTAREDVSYLATLLAPFTYGQVQSLNKFQKSGRMHPFTCGGKHVGQAPILVAGRDGWTCPDDTCPYTQNWAHGFMAAEDVWQYIGYTLQPVTLFGKETHDKLIAAIKKEAHECGGPDEDGCKLSEQDCNRLHGIRWDGVVGGDMHIAGEVGFIVAFVLSEMTKMGHGDDCKLDGVCVAPLTYSEGVAAVNGKLQIGVNHGEGEEYVTLPRQDVEMVYDITKTLLGIDDEEAQQQIRLTAVRYASRLGRPMTGEDLVRQAKAIEQYLTKGA